MVQVASGPPVMMDIIPGIDVTCCALVGIDTIPAVAAGTGGIPVIMDIAVADLVTIGPDGDSAVWTVSDFKAIHNIVAAVYVESHVSVGGVQSVDHSAASGLRFQHDGASRRSAGT